MYGTSTPSDSSMGANCSLLDSWDVVTLAGNNRMRLSLASRSALRFFSLSDTVCATPGSMTTAGSQNMRIVMSMIFSSSGGRNGISFQNSFQVFSISPPA